MKFLLLDDEADFRVTVRRILERENHDVIEAKDGSLGLQAMKAGRPDLIISDIRVPKMSGDEFFQQIRAAETDLRQIIAGARKFVPFGIPAIF